MQNYKDDYDSDDEHDILINLSSPEIWRPIYAECVRIMEQREIQNKIKLGVAQR